MKELITETLKTFAPYILLVINLLVVPLLKRGYNSLLTFFSLPAGQQIEAIDYLQSAKIPTGSMGGLKHKIKMIGFKLHEDIDLSKCIIRLYYENRSKNSYLAKNLLRAKGMYAIKDNALNIRWSMTWLVLFFASLSAGEFYLSYMLFNNVAVDELNLIPAWVLLICSLVYGGTAFNFTCQYVSIWRGRKRFNEILKMYLLTAPLNSVGGRRCN
ncbi:hypothetical protein ACM915_000457 [Cronobacter turicensis]